jgi:ADP-ribose pyrophosphatase YjhB (NUDIX family)
MLSDHAIAHIGQYALIKNKKGQLLILENMILKRAGLPGGRLEEGERWDESLMREVKEECNVECCDPKPFAVHLVDGDEFIKYCAYFTVRTAYPLSARVDDTKYRLRWVSIKSVGKIRFYNNEVKGVVFDFLKA